MVFVVLDSTTPGVAEFDTFDAFVATLDDCDGSCLGEIKRTFAIPDPGVVLGVLFLVNPCKDIFLQEIDRFGGFVAAVAFN